MHSLKYLIILAIGIMLFSCEKQNVNTTLYYNIDSLIQAQANFLTASHAVLTKKAEIDGEEETSTLDSVTWMHELDIFSELKVINTPNKTGKYTIESGVKDPNSNLTIRSFTGKDTLPIVYLKLFYLDNPSKIRRIEALYREENSLLKGSRLLILEFQEIHNKIVLTSYSIEGSQKMFLGDSVKFSVKGSITIP